MPILGIISDIHSNLAALEDAFSIFQRQRVDRIYCVGDIVGYGVEPEACCVRIKVDASAVVAGNHDYAVCDRIDYLPFFNPEAILGVHYAKKVLMNQTREWLCNLPLTYEDPWLQMVHGSLCQPARFCYLRNNGLPQDDAPFQEVSLTFDRMTRQVCFVGHSHEPMIYIEDRNGSIRSLPEPEKPFFLRGRRAVINAGSASVPRNGQNRGCIVIYDPDGDAVQFINFPITPSYIPEWIAQALDWPET
jgi:predicted phosphodiesterase